jgi:hypothetical protein
VIVNACTRLRFCTADDTMELREKRGPGAHAGGFVPWFEHANRRSARTTIVCGHWSTLELMLAPNVLMLDSGCLWGGTLTAVRLPIGVCIRSRRALRSAKAVRIDASAARASSRGAQHAPATRAARSSPR